MTYAIRDSDTGLLRAAGSHNVNLSKAKQHGIYSRENGKKR